ncbi:phytoene dehydrogenase-like protein [Bacillus mesophilus]|uniref:FAD-dependent oxidoreductase n=1 Tax=Bacillus mesophilus TaxID=1808955 RepID=A0A6M0Q9R5_9BACI|nr:FAD-dependent oxidoreductase [Bacillus mesophilus]MBM7662327.1 phytoene dehydrogenase-like protein [Bacillus mesophilus]NEY73043.1 FAD-dependent oxidoreductase [Bacillus mesophilus]
MSKSICIIGAGVGGLTAGAYLAKAGFQVTILELATTVGGSAGAYVRKNRTFPTGATVAFGLEEGGVLRSLLEDLDISVPNELLDHPMDVVLPTGKISIYRDAGLWEQELKRFFPSNPKEVLAFWNELHRISLDVLRIVENRIALPVQLHDLQKLIKIAITSPGSSLRLARYSNWTVEDLMKKYKVDQLEPFRQFLNAQLIDAVQTDVSNAALLPSSLALTIYRNGSFSIDQGLVTLCRALANRITVLGGNVHLSSPVMTVNFNKSLRNWEVNSTKVQDQYDIVINNAGVSFGSGTSFMEEEVFSWGAFRIDAILDGEIAKELNDGKFPFALQIVPTTEQYKLLRNVHGPIYVTFHHSRDRSGNVIEDEVMMTASVHTQPSQWFAFTKEQYKYEKELVRKDIIDIIHQTVPLKDLLRSVEAGTPLTYKKFVGKAEVGGFPLSVKNAIRSPKSVRSGNRQLYIVGEQAFPGPGTLSSALSGYYAAKAIIKGLH